MQKTFSEAIESYAQYRKVNRGLSKSTLYSDNHSLRSLMSLTGDIYVHNITSDHIERKLAEIAGNGTKAGAYNNYIAKYKAFFDFCRMRQYMPRTNDPLREIHRRKTTPRDSRRVPVHQFPALLDSAINIRNRTILATGLYLLCRSGEIKTLKVRDLNLAESRVRVTVHKSGGWVDNMPITSELDAELRAWMTYYTEITGQVPDPEWPLFPGQHYRHLNKGTGARYVPGHGDFHLDVNYMAGRLDEIAKRALNDIGFATRGPDGKPLNEGMHTLRRSGARALFDRLVEDSYDGAIRLVQSMLHHRNMATTEIYLGLNMEKHKRDELLTGRPMYATTDRSNVVPIREVGNG